MHRAAAMAVIAAALAVTTVRAAEPGCAERVNVRGEVRLDRAFGVRSLGRADPIDARTVFRLASVSKQFTAAAVLTLVAEGRLSLNDHLRTLLPELPAYTERITVRHLLTHTSGLPDYEELMEADTAAGGTTYTAARQIDDAAVIRLLARTTTPRFAPGSRWAYSNSAYVVLGVLVARVSGQPFARYLADKVFRPNGLRATQLRVPGHGVMTHRAYGHAGAPGVWRPSDQSSTSATGGDGGVYSSVEDLAHWLTLVADGRTVFDRFADEAFAAVTLADGTAARWPVEADEDNLDPGGTVAYGFGWFLDPALGARRRWHFGTSEGFRTAIDWFPDRRVVSVVLCNRMDLDAKSRALHNAEPYLLP